MCRLTTEERVKIAKLYYISGDSNVVTFRAFRVDYGCHDRPIVQGIYRIIKKFKETGSVTDMVTTVHHRYVRIAENVASVGESVGYNPNFNSERYGYTITDFLGLQLNIMNRTIGGFNKAVPRSHTTWPILALLHEKFPESVSSRFVDVNWPQRSCGLYFFFVGLCQRPCLRWSI